jgi:cobalt/nickel transport system permease protein
MMGIPALLSYHVFQLRFSFGQESRRRLGIFAFFAGAIGVGVASLIFFALVIMNIPAHLDASLESSALWGLVVAQIPLMIIEGLFTTLLMLFFLQVKPSLIEG